MKSPTLTGCRLKRRFMKNASVFSMRCQCAAQGLLLTLALLAAGSAGAQNYVRNPNWAQPLGPDNWTVAYVAPSTAADFWLHGRTLLAHRDASFGTWDGMNNFDSFYPSGPCYFGGHFRPYTGGYVEAYFDQVVTNLTPGVSYVASAWMVQFQSDYVSKSQVWLEARGSTVATTPYVLGYAYNNNGWAMYSATTPANAYGQIEVRLHFKKIGFTGGTGSSAGVGWGGYLNIDAFYDHISVMPAVPVTLPPPRILSLRHTNQTATVNWSTVMNNTYDIQVSSDLVSWSPFQTNFFATGTNLAYTGTLSADPSLPQFFRIACYNWVP